MKFNLKFDYWLFMARHRSAAADTADIIVPRSPPSSSALRAAAVLPPGEVTSSCNHDQILVLASKSWDNIFSK